ncbi:MAG: lamin tail domain-containing protein [Patescibacteria group bacterium]
MKKRYVIASLIVASMQCLLPVMAVAEDTVSPALSTSSIIITEVQTGATLGSDEFVELYNAGDSTVEITDWQLRYLNASTTGNATTLIAAITSPDDSPILLASHEYYLLHTASVLLPLEIKK